MADTQDTDLEELQATRKKVDKAIDAIKGLKDYCDGTKDVTYGGFINRLTGLELSLTSVKDKLKYADTAKQENLIMVPNSHIDKGLHEYQQWVPKFEQKVPDVIGEAARLISGAEQAKPGVQDLPDIIEQLDCDEKLARSSDNIPEVAREAAGWWEKKIEETRQLYSAFKGVYLVPDSELARLVQAYSRYRSATIDQILAAVEGDVQKYQDTQTQDLRNERKSMRVLVIEALPQGPLLHELVDESMLEKLFAVESPAQLTPEMVKESLYKAVKSRDTDSVQNIFDVVSKLSELEEQLRDEPEVHLLAAHAQLGVAEDAEGYKDAIKRYEKAIELEPDSIEAHLGIAKAYGGLTYIAKSKGGSWKPFLKKARRHIRQAMEGGELTEEQEKRLGPIAKLAQAEESKAITRAFRGASTALGFSSGALPGTYIQSKHPFAQFLVWLEGAWPEKFEELRNHGWNIDENFGAMGQWLWNNEPYTLGIGAAITGGIGAYMGYKLSAWSGAKQALSRAGRRAKLRAEHSESEKLAQTEPEKAEYQAQEPEKETQRYIDRLEIPKTPEDLAKVLAKLYEHHHKKPHWREELLHTFSSVIMKADALEDLTDKELDDLLLKQKVHWIHTPAIIALYNKALSAKYE